MSSVFKKPLFEDVTLEEAAALVDVPIDFTYENSPMMQSPLWGLPQPYPWQSAIASALWKGGSQVAARTCNEAGKTGYLVPLIIASFMAAFPSGQVAVTSASERQLEKQLWPSMKNLIARLPKWRTVGNTIYAPSMDGLPESSCVIFATKQGELFEGFHVRIYEDKYGRKRFSPLLIIFDEAKSVKHQIWVAGERCNPTNQLVISTCGEDSGDFYNACMNTDGQWTTEYDGIHFKIPWTMCPHLLVGNTYKRKRALLEFKGVDDPDVRSILLAEFFRGGLQMVFGEHELMCYRECCSGMVQPSTGGRMAACDFAAGGDELVFGVRDGNTLKALVGWHETSKSPPSEVAKKYINHFKNWELRPNQIIADEGGLGQLIINEIERMGYRGIRRYNASTAAIHKDRFVNQYAEDTWNFKQHLVDKTVCFEGMDDVLYNQMRLRRYTMKNDDSNKIRTEPKKDAREKRQEQSPDRLDLMIMLFKNLGPLRFARAGRSPTRCPTPNDYRKAMSEEEEDDDFSLTGGGWVSS